MTFIEIIFVIKISKPETKSVTMVRIFQWFLLYQSKVDTYHANNKQKQ